MDGPVAPEHQARVEKFQREHRTRLLTLLFTDIVGSGKIKQALGDREGVALIQRHHALVREMLSRFPEAQEIDTAGDSFFIVLVKPSDAVRFALRLQSSLRALAKESPHPVYDRIGIHIGEVIIEQGEDSSRLKHLFGSQVDLCARIMSLASGDQILLSRGAFDNARQALKGDEIEGLAELAWLNHGPYLLKGLEESTEICEVGEAGRACLRAPADVQKAQRQVSPESEPVLGWRPAIGQMVPKTKWVLERKLGEGGFGEVWLGRHQTMKERRVFKFCFRADRVRFLKREMTLFRLLKERVGDHPNIVRLLEVYFDEPPFYVEMDYVEGKDLKSWWDQQDGADKVPLDVRLEIVAQVADALQAAHDAGVIHRDVKPSNILVAVGGSRREFGVPPSGGQGFEPSGRVESEDAGPAKAGTPNDPLAASQPQLRVLAKLTDFGIGQVVSEDSLAGITRAGFTRTLMSDSSTSHTGTQLYMAPELLAGKPASTRSDIYSLGVVLYQLLVGDFTRPLTTDWADHVSDPLLRDDLKHCFAGNPHDRFAGAGQFAESLRLLPQRQAARLKLQKAERASRRRRRVTVVASGIAAALFLLSISLGYGLRRAWRSELDTRQLLYASDMSLAYHAWENNQIDRILHLLNQHRPLPGQKRDLRGWEWRLLWQLCENDYGHVIELGSHSNAVSSVLFSPKGDFLATSGGSDLRLWNVATRRAAGVLPHEAPVLAAVFLPDGKSLATLSADGTLRSWDFSTAREQSRVGIGPKSQVLTAEAAEFSPDGRLVALSQRDGTLDVWQGSRNTKLVAFTDRPAYCMAFSPDGKMLATGYQDSRLINLWDLDGKRHLLVLTNRAKLTLSLAFSHNGKMLASATADDRSIHVWNIGTREVKWTLTGHASNPWQVAFFPGDKTLASASSDRTVKLWNLETGQEITTLYGYLNEIFTLAVAPDGRTLATGIRGGTVVLSSAMAKPREEVSRRSSLEMASRPPFAIFSQGGATLLALNADSTLGVWDASSFTERSRLTLDLTNSLYAVSPTGKFLAIGESSGAIKVLETSTQKEVARLAEKCPADGELLFSSDEKKLAWPTVDGKIRISEIATRQTLTEIANQTNSATALAFSLDDALLGVGYGDGRNEIFETSNGKRLAMLRGHTDRIVGMVFFPNGNKVATASWDQTVKLWNIKTGHQIKSLGGQPFVYWTIALSPDGRRLAAGGDGTIQVWDTATYHEVIALKRDADEIHALAFSPDGTTLFAAGQEIKGKRTLSLQVWRAPSLSEINAAETAKRKNR